MKFVSLLAPIDLHEHLDKLTFTPGQVCTVANISRMQLDYWTQRAGIPTGGHIQRTFDFAALELVLLIKQARDLGLSLDTSIETARNFLAREHEEAVSFDD